MNLSLIRQLLRLLHWQGFLENKLQLVSIKAVYLFSYFLKYKRLIT